MNVLRLSPYALVTLLTGAGIAMLAVPALSATLGPPGKTLVAHTEGAAVVLYNASPEVSAIVDGHLSDADAQDRLERDALRALSSKLAGVPHAVTVTVRVLYDESNDVSPSYGAYSFVGTEHYADLTMKADDARSDRDRWQESAAATTALPKWIQFTVVGALPSR